MQKTIEKIHSEFDNAQDQILSEAKSIIANDAMFEKCNRLKELGFTSSATVKKSREATRSAELISIIDEYLVKYHSHKFITQEVVDKICKKYGLLFSVVSNYIGDVPDKNLNEIEDFVGLYNITIEKPSWMLTGTVHFWVNGSGVIEKPNFEEPTSKEFKIVAPPKDFNQKNKTKKGYELVNDPIVLYPVKAGYIIVTKWGLEASDESLINEKQN